MFSDYGTKSSSVLSGAQILTNVRSLYREANILAAKLALYQSATDPAFNAAVNATYTVAERAELAAMLTEVTALVTDWETNHPQAIGNAS